jgi:hypothetical protein
MTSSLWGSFLVPFNSSLKAAHRSSSSSVGSSPILLVAPLHRYKLSLIMERSLPSCHSSLIHKTTSGPFRSVSVSLILHREQSVWALANISGHTDLARDQLLAVNILDFCLECLNLGPNQQSGCSLSAYPLQFLPPAWAHGLRIAYPTPSLFLMQHFTNLFANLVRYLSFFFSSELVWWCHRDKPLPAPEYVHKVIVMAFELYQSPVHSHFLSCPLVHLL